MKFVDSHCHLDFDSFDEDRESVIENAHKEGIVKMLTISTQIKQSDKLSMIADSYEYVYTSIGTHPRYAEDEKDITVDDIVSLTDSQKTVAIGEAGLDYHYDFSDKDVQKHVFINHIKAAQRTGIPLIIHARQADKDMADILIEYRQHQYFDILLHCFSSGTLLADVGKELGAWFSFSGIITFSSAQKIRDIAQTIDMDKLLIETDAPYLAPVPYRGKRNEPRYVIHTAQKLADIKGVSLECIAEQTTKNFHTLFKRIPV